MESESGGCSWMIEGPNPPSKAPSRVNSAVCLVNVSRTNGGGVTGEAEICLEERCPRNNGVSEPVCLSRDRSPVLFCTLSFTL